MNAADFHNEVKRTSSADFPYEQVLALSGLGLAGEVAEIAALVDNATATKPIINRAEVQAEAGDVLWYLTYLLNALDMRLEGLMGTENFSEYQQRVRREVGVSIDLRTSMIRLCEYSGGAADIIKKNILHGHDLKRDYLVDKLHNTLWYLTAILNEFYLKLEDAVEGNVVKLRKRYPEGWDAERSINREKYA